MAGDLKEKRWHHIEDGIKEILIDPDDMPSIDQQKAFSPMALGQLAEIALVSDARAKAICAVIAATGGKDDPEGYNKLISQLQSPEIFIQVSESTFHTGIPRHRVIHESLEALIYSPEVNLSFSETCKLLAALLAERDIIAVSDMTSEIPRQVMDYMNRLYKYQMDELLQLGSIQSLLAYYHEQTAIPAKWLDIAIDTGRKRRSRPHNDS